MPDLLQARIIRVEALLQDQTLHIPLYQRPYKWTPRNVVQLLDDIHRHQDRSAYRLGTIVLHQEGAQTNIVDGQQRIVTLLLIVRAILASRTNIQNPELENALSHLKSGLFDPTFHSEISVANVRANYREIERQVSSMEEAALLFLLKRCEVLQFVLSDISEAFQFFDSQNARGRELEPHDLLKAFHLREFSDEDEAARLSAVQTWESMETRTLASLFADFLFRVRAWSQGQSARHFGKNDVALFKGVSLQTMRSPSTQLLRIAHVYLDAYNQSYERQIDGQHAAFPFQLTQPILNGRRFFEMVAHYNSLREQYREDSAKKWPNQTETQSIFQALSTYPGRSRTGDQYIRNLFDCAVLMYIDRFGDADLPRVLEKLFLWAYSLRLRSYAVRLATVDNYVLQESNVFQRIQHAVTPQDVLLLEVPPLPSVRSTKTKSLEHLFASLGYHEHKQ